MNYSHLTVQPGRPGAPNSQHNQAPPVSAGNLLPQQQQQASKGVSNPQNHSMVHANLPLLGPNISLNAKIADDKAPQLGNNNLGGFQQQISHAQQLPIRNPNLPTMLHPMQQQTNKQMAQSHQSMQKPQIAPNPIPHQPPVYQIQVPVMHQQSLMHKSPAYPPLSSLPLKGNNYGPPTQAPQSHLLQTPPKSHPQLKTTMKVGSPSSLAMGSTQKLATIPPVSSQYLGQPNKNLVPSSIPATGPQPSLSAYQPLSQPQMTYSVNKPVTKAPAPQNFSASKAPVTSSPAKVAPLTITCKAGQPAVSTFGTTPVVPQLVKATTVQAPIKLSIAPAKTEAKPEEKKPPTPSPVVAQTAKPFSSAPVTSIPEKQTEKVALSAPVFNASAKAPISTPTPPSKSTMRLATVQPKRPRVTPVANKPPPAKSPVPVAKIVQTIAPKAEASKAEASPKPEVAPKSEVTTKSEAVHKLETAPKPEEVSKQEVLSPKVAPKKTTAARVSAVISESPAPVVAIKTPKVAPSTSASTPKAKRVRTKTQPYQSPLPEIALITKLTSQQANAANKNGDDKLTIFYKNEFLALRNGEGGYFLCQTMHNVYKSSPKIRIRWLNEGKKEGATKKYSLDFYDMTDIECVLTTVELDKIDSKVYELPTEELTRIENILQRALDVEKGILPRPTVTEENPDGLDLSLYKDESQLEKSPKKRKADGDSDSKDEDEIKEKPPIKVARGASKKLNLKEKDESSESDDENLLTISKRTKQDEPVASTAPKQGNKRRAGGSPASVPAAKIVRAEPAKIVEKPKPKGRPPIAKVAPTTKTPDKPAVAAKEEVISPVVKKPVIVKKAETPIVKKAVKQPAKKEDSPAVPTRATRSKK